MNFAVAIDGPNGAGKSSIAREVARRLGFVYVDTGALYRAIGLYILRKGIASDDVPHIVAELPNISVTLEHRDDGQHVLLNGEDVTDMIRTPEASIYASDVSKIREVRTALLDQQREIAATNNVIMDGRDIGTVILPNAQVKIYLTASVDERAHRRHKELLERGREVTLGEVRADLIWRDKNDSTRALAPLKPADDAVTVDTTNLTFTQSVEKIYKMVVDRLDS